MAQECITPALETSVEKSPHPEPIAQESSTPAPARPEAAPEMDSLAELDMIEAELSYLAEWVAQHPDFRSRLFIAAETLEEAAREASESVKRRGLDIPPSEFNVRLSVPGYGRDIESYEPRRQAGCRST